MQTVPFSTRPREIVFDSLSGGYGYAFDFDNPSGVKLLPPRVFSRLGSSSDLSRASAGDESLRAAVALLRQNPLTETNARLTVWLHVINGCNFACHYCYVPHLNRFVDRRTLEKHSLGQQTIHPLLNNLLGYCEAEHLTELHINFAGGEPTLNLSLVEEFCREASVFQSSVKLTFGMISNGSFEANELIPLLERYNISLSLSVDGYEDSHDRIRFELDGRVKRGSWKQLATNVKALVDRQIIPYFLYTVTPSNYESIADLAAYAHGNRIGFRLSLVRTKVSVTNEIQVRIADELCRFYDGLGETLDVGLPILRFAAFA
jgi:sulfatase maturation enzyme AslB (radical SAM superfamily)